MLKPLWTRFNASIAMPLADTRQIAWLFLRGLGGIYLFHFLTIWPQIRGVIGPHGVTPIADNLTYHWSVSHWAPLLNPTLAWISADSSFLLFLCALGAVFAALLLAGYRHLVILFSLWLIHLTFVNSSLFFGFIWDLCLAQVGLSSLLFASVSFQRETLNSAEPPTRLAVFTMRFVFFHVMFMMAFCKIFSAEENWKNLDFLKWFYSNQPMPSIISWWMAKLPTFFTQTFSLATMIIEALLAAIFFIPATWRFRKLAFFLSLFLQTTIFFSGNFGYFNILMMVLSLFLLSDRSLPWRSEPVAARPRGRRATLAGCALTTVLVVANSSLYYLVDFNQLYSPYENEWTKLEKFLYPFVTYRVMVPYDIFGTVPRTHRKMVIETSQDNETWTELKLVYGPGDLERAPQFSEPFQWRLDHELFYGGQRVRQLKREDDKTKYVDAYWIEGLSNGILRHEPDVLSLFPEQPALSEAPQALRISIYDYRFATLAEHRASGRWWQRELYLRSDVATSSHLVKQPWLFR